jgi:hypothetical protein
MPSLSALAHIKPFQHGPWPARWHDIEEVDRQDALEERFTYSLLQTLLGEPSCRSR